MKDKTLGIATVTVLVSAILTSAWIDSDNTEDAKYTISCDNHELTSTCVIHDNIGTNIADLSVMEAENYNLFNDNKQIEVWLKESK